MKRNIQCEMAEELPQTSKKSSKNHVLRRATSSSNNGPSEPVQNPPAIEAKTWWKCKNSACRAILHIEEIFCKRCSCCICQLFDDNKDPSLWFACTSESSEIDSCGSSCHIECALEHRKVMQLDGTYSCASCGKVLEILGYWKKQVVMAKDARRVDVLCYRISLSYRLLDGTSKHNEVHELIKAAKAKLESELGPLDENLGKMSRGLASRLSVARDVHTLCTLAIEKADELLASKSNGPRDFDLNVALVPDLNEEQLVPEESSRDEDVGRNAGQAVEAYNVAVVSHDTPRNCPEKRDGTGDSDNGKTVEVQPDDYQLEVYCKNKQPSTNREMRDSASTPTNESPSVICNVPGIVDDDFEYCVKIIRRLECEGYIEKEFRLKMLTWFGLRSTEAQRQIVRTFIRTITDDPSSLAGQLIHTFSDVISSTRQ